MSIYFSCPLQCTALFLGSQSFVNLADESCESNCLLCTEVIGRERLTGRLGDPFALLACSHLASFNMWHIAITGLPSQHVLALCGRSVSIGANLRCQTSLK